jgi:hypothetical protein
MCATRLLSWDYGSRAPIKALAGRCSRSARKCAAAVATNACSTRNIMNIVEFAPKCADPANKRAAMQRGHPKSTEIFSGTRERVTILNLIPGQTPQQSHKPRLASGVADLTKMFHVKHFCPIWVQNLTSLRRRPAFQWYGCSIFWCNWNSGEGDAPKL